MFAGTAIFSQEIDYAKFIQTGKWFPGFNITSKKIIYSKKSLGKVNEETVEFRPNGKMVRCGEVTESSLSKEGKEITTTHFRCDSNQTYKIENRMMQIRLLQEQPNFYKIQVKSTSFELTPVKSEADNQQ